ncbi:MAG TPA: hypothetical protein VLL25_15455 [Acidimicrobiales bacterium]|nr:hypothetical protein [Acidimicrobiales bacterium]
MTSPISCSVCQHVLGVDESRAVEKGQLTACPACGSPIQVLPPTGTDDTGAFQRFYSGSATDKAGRGSLQRFVGWWRDRVKRVTAR